MADVLAAPVRNRGLACIRVSGPTAAMVCATLADRGMVCVDAEEPGAGEYTLRRAGGTAIVAWREEREEPLPQASQPPKPPRPARPRQSPRERAKATRPPRVRGKRPTLVRSHQPRPPRGLAWLDKVPQEFGVADVLRVQPDLLAWTVRSHVIELRRAGLVSVVSPAWAGGAWRYRKTEGCDG